jgi:hypothetical protein
MDGKYSSKAQDATLRTRLLAVSLEILWRQHQEYLRDEQLLRMAQIPICNIVDDMIREAWMKDPYLDEKIRHEALKEKKILSLEPEEEFEGKKARFVATTCITAELAPLLTYPLLMDTFRVKVDGDWLVVSSITSRKK